MLLEVLHRASYAQDGQIVHLGAYDKGKFAKRLTEYAPLRAGHYDMG